MSMSYYPEPVNTLYLQWDKYVVKGTWQMRLRISRWGGYPALSRLAQYNLRGPYKREAVQVGGGVMMEVGRSNVRKGPRAEE